MLENSLQLRKMNFIDVMEQWEYVTTQPNNENGLVNRYKGISFDTYRDAILPELMMHENPINLPAWFVPETFYYLWYNNTLIGEFRIRHFLTEALRVGSGHIGFSIKKRI